jgi:hypothetical protein
LTSSNFSLGRKTITVPVGPIANTVAWYGLLLRAGGGDVFVGRPAGQRGAASQSRAMLAFRVDDIPEFSDLEVTTDAAQLRAELGARIGIDENRGNLLPWGERLEANFGHAVLLTLQGQNEVANRNQLFHRANEEGVSRAIQNTLPYFLGAWPADQALRRQELTAARRDLRRAEAELEHAERLNAEVDTGLTGLLSEAYAQGLVETGQAAGGRPRLRCSPPRSDTKPSARPSTTSSWSGRANSRPLEANSDASCGSSPTNAPCSPTRTLPSSTTPAPSNRSSHA